MKILGTVLTALLSGSFIFCAVGIFSHHNDTRVNRKEMDEVMEEVIYESAKAGGEENGEKMEQLHIDFGKLKEFNVDTTGWIAFNGQCINYPIVRTDDNSYYLNHSFRGNKNAAGSVFMDCRNESFDDPNVVIYGHNMLDHTMFGSLKDVFQEEFWEKEECDIIWVTDIDSHMRKYKIFSYYTIKAEDYYITTAFEDTAAYDKFLSVIQARSFRELDVTVTTDDHILTLSTCSGPAGTGKRRVVHAKLIEIE